MFVPTSDTIVHTPLADVLLDAHSVVLLMSFRNGLSVFDLDDLHGYAVVVKAGGHEIVLSPGMQTLITNDSEQSFEQINPAQSVGYRNMKARVLENGLKAFVSEFSIAHTMATVTTLKQLISARHPRAHKVADHMLKTTAILQQLRGGNYTQFIRPNLTAYNELSCTVPSQ